MRESTSLSLLNLLELYQELDKKLKALSISHLVKEEMESLGVAIALLEDSNLDTK